jgi:hypothetical protein
MTGREIRVKVIGEVCGEMLPADPGRQDADTWPERLADAIGGVAARLRQYEKQDDSDRRAVRLADLKDAVARAAALADSFRATVEPRVESFRQ